jgi:septal ring factor EnvC (AmiA/AmiB activator)|nr:MAG TPA: tail tape measure protein [Bacteriophage sp.]DAT12865.1 MAG TPA: tail tape measure protein [Bacteriophage sp.]
MAGIFVNVDSDIQKLQKLKQEIENVKKSLKSINVKVDIDIAQGLEAQLKNLTTQYDVLAAKVGETEAKMTASANKIIDASNKIIQAQDKMSQAAKGINASSSSTNSSTNTSETTSIQAQVKAYEELKAEIGDVLGTRGQNIKRLIEEQNAIRLLNAEIKKITKSQGESSSLSSAQQRRLEQLNNSLLTHKTALAEVRQSLSANAKLDNAAATSMDALSQSLGRMRAAYRTLTESERTSPFGKELLVSIQQADAKIKELDATIGNHQRNVGNYASGWNGLNMSIQQIGRELPSLAVGWSTFFLAISNNLPILADEIKRARIQFEALKKSGQAATPVWKQVVSSIVSWQTALTVGITLLTLYGDKLVKWISSLGKAEKAIKDLYTAQRDLYNVTSTGIEQSSKEITKLNSLYKIATDVTKSTKERNNAVKELKRSYPEHLKNLSDESIKNGEVSKSIKEQTNQIIANAKATAAADQIARNWYKSFQAGVSKNISYITKQRLEQELAAKEATVQQLSQMRARPESYAGLAKEIEGIKDRIKETDKEIAKQENLQDSYQKSSKALEKLVTVAGLGGKYEDPDKNYNSILDQQKKIADLLDKQALERRRKEEDLENQAIQSRIDTMTEGEAKIRAQRELDNKKEIQDLERQREDYIRTEIEYQKKLFDVQEELNAKKSKDYKKKTFDPSTVKVDTSKFNELISNELIKQSIAPYKEEAKAWNEYLVEYGNFQQKKVAINAEYNQKIVEATTKGEKESLKKERDSKLKEVTFDELKKSINFADIFGDLDTQSTETLTKMRDKLKEIIDKSAKDLKPTDLKALQEAFSNIDLKIVERNPFGELKQGIEGYKSATEAVIKAQEDLNTVQEGGEVIIGQYTDKTGKVVTKLLTQEQAERNLSDAQKGRLESQGKLTKAVNSIGQQGQQLVNAGNNLVDMLTNLGVEVPESISGALSGLGQIMSGLESIDLTKPFSIISSTTGILAGITKTISSFFGGPDGTAYYEGVKEQLEAINEVYDRIIDKSKEDIVFGGGFASVQAATQAMDNYEKKVINLQKIAAASGRAGASWKSHSAEWHSNKNVGAIGGFEQMSDILGKSISSMTDLYSLSGDELFLIQSQMPEAWNLIDARIRENLDSIVACKDEANELRDALNQAMTGVDFDSFYNGFIDQLSDMDTSFEDMCDNFEDYLRKSIMAGLVASQYQGRINALYEQWSDTARSDSKITKNEADLLKEQYQQIVEDMMHDREEMFKTFGWDTSATSQESSKKGFATASQDSIDELNGRFTALQIAGEEIKNQNQLQTMSILELRADMLPIITNTTGIKDIASETRDLLRLSYEELTGIHDDTTSMNKSLKNIETDIAEVKRNTSKL